MKIIGSYTITEPGPNGEHALILILDNGQRRVAVDGEPKMGGLSVTTDRAEGFATGYIAGLHARPPA